MALNVFRKATLRNCFSAKNVLSTRHYSLYEPDYLEANKSKIPDYNKLDVQIKGYSYSVLESYHSFITRYARLINIKVDDSWALPATVLKVHKYKKGSTVIEAEYDLHLYERHTQLINVTSIQYPLLIRTLEAILPEGVFLKVELFNSDLELKRYIPDKELLDKKLLLETYQKK